jgi:hypothetical protein
MNAQSDGGDLFGGYRPTSVRAVLRPIFDDIMAIVGKSSSFRKCMTKQQRKSIVDEIQVLYLYFIVIIFCFSSETTMVRV